MRFPGRYPIKRGETLASVLERAGGLTTLAFVEGSVSTAHEVERIRAVRASSRYLIALGACASQEASARVVE